MIDSQKPLKDFFSIIEHQPPVPRPKFSNLTAVKLLQNLKASAVAARMGVSRSTMSYHVKRFQQLGIVAYRGYGTWEVLINDELRLEELLGKEVRTSLPYRSSVEGGVAIVRTSNRVHSSLVSDTIRSHAVQAVVKLPVLRRWKSEDRQRVLSQKGIAFSVVPQGERIFVLDCRVWLTNGSLVVWLPFSWFVPDANTGYSYAVYELERVIRAVESLLGVSFRIGGRHVFRVSRQHHSLIKNSLAHQLNKDKEKLYVFDSQGLWLLVDDSEHLDEVEGVANRGVQGKDSRNDIERVKDWFNGVKNTGLTPEGVLQMIQSNGEHLRYYAENVVAHVKAVQALAEATKNINTTLAELKEVIKK